MESNLKVLGHPLHPMLIVFPLGLFVTAFAFDIVYLITGDSLWAEMAYWLIAGGVVGGVLASAAGWVDWFAIPSGTRAKKIGFIHGAANGSVLVLFIVSWFWRQQAAAITDPDAMAIILAGVAVAIAGVGGWLGGELVDRMGVGVDRGAHLNSPNSLSGKPAETQESLGGTPGQIQDEQDDQRRAA
ncbi:MAG: DUF2231 domain-containing protein [Dehalococcoidia bacterium]